MFRPFVSLLVVVVVGASYVGHNDRPLQFLMLKPQDTIYAEGGPEKQPFLAALNVNELKMREHYASKSPGEAWQLNQNPGAGHAMNSTMLWMHTLIRNCGLLFGCCMNWQLLHTIISQQCLWCLGIFGRSLRWLCVPPKNKCSCLSIGIAMFQCLCLPISQPFPGSGSMRFINQCQKTTHVRLTFLALLEPAHDGHLAQNVWPCRDFQCIQHLVLWNFAVSTFRGTGSQELFAPKQATRCLLCAHFCATFMELFAGSLLRKFTGLS